MDYLFDGFLERLEQVVGGKQSRAEVCLDLEGILPVHSLDLALYFNDVAMRAHMRLLGQHDGS